MVINKEINIISFRDCLEIAGDKKKHLILENGFSVSLFPDIFNYRVLAERYDLINILKAVIGKLFELIEDNKITKDDFKIWRYRHIRSYYIFRPLTFFSFYDLNFNLIFPFI